MSNPFRFNLRKHERLKVEPMYTSVLVQRADGPTIRTLEGHAYDISEGGARIELDESIGCGERVALSLRLPRETMSVFAMGRVVWENDETDDPGPRRMAIQFTQFLSDADHARLVRHLGVNARRRAA